MKGGGGGGSDGSEEEEGILREGWRFMKKEKRRR